MKRLLQTALFMCLFSWTMYAQQLASGDILKSLSRQNSGSAQISIKLDPGIEDNYYKHLIYNSKNPDVIGYRIRIFSGSGNDAKQNADAARARFLSRYPDIGAYLKYDAPDYKVYVGDCRTQSEVLKLFERINQDFPYAFITPKQAIDPDKYISSLKNE